MIRGIFPRPADRHLHQHRAQRRQYHNRQHPDNAAPVIPVAAKEEGEIGEHADCTRQRCRDSHGQGIVIADMSQFMGDHTGEFLLTQDFHQTAGDGDRCILRVASRGEGIGLRIVHDEHFRHRQFGPRGEF